MSQARHQRAGGWRRLRCQLVWKIARPSAAPGVRGDRALTLTAGANSEPCGDMIECWRAVEDVGILQPVDLIVSVVDPRGSSGAGFADGVVGKWERRARR